MNTWLLAGGSLAAAALVVAGIILMVRRRRSVAGILRRRAWKRLEDFTLPDDVDGEIHVDVLLLSPAGLVVIERRRFEGTVFAGEGLDSWTALHRKGRSVVRNPLQNLRARLHAVRALAPGAPVTGYLVILGDARFSGSPPERVVTPARLEEVLPAPEGEPPENLARAWMAVEAAARGLG